jgi:putative Mn2+ efflux pump MntP
VVDLIVLLGIAVGLATDAFAVAIVVSVGLGGASRRQVFRLGWHFGLFQGLMPVIGWAAGSSLRPVVGRWDHWLAFVLLGVIGGRMVLEAARGAARPSAQPDPTRGWSLVGLSVATSIDAFAVGLSFAALGVRVWLPALVIGLTAGAVTVLGTLCGSRLGLRFGRRVSAVGGLLLIAIGCWMVIEHLSAA